MVPDIRYESQGSYNPSTDGSLPHSNPGFGPAFGRYRDPRNRVSLVASLAILALVVGWLGTVLRWQSGSITEVHSGAVTLYSFEAVDSSTDRLLRLFSLALFVLAGLFGALESRRPRLPILVAFLFPTMLAYCAYWFLVSNNNLLEYWSMLTTAASPLVFTMCLGIFAGFDVTLWPKLRLVALAIAYASGALAAYYTVRLTINGTFIGNNPAVDHLQIAFWFALCALALHKSSRWRDCVPALIPIAFCIPMAIVAVSRSFTLLAALGLVTGLLIPLQPHFRQMWVRILALGFLAALVLGVGLWSLFLAAPERVVALNDRLLQDTRSAQYEQFFEQVPLESLIVGLGPKATYTYGERTEYEYLDNQLLWILFKLGLPVLLGYCAVVIWPGLCLLVRARTQQHRLLGAIFVFWTLAALGVSIFHSITANPQNFVIVLMAGGAYALDSARRTQPFAPRGVPLPGSQPQVSSIDVDHPFTAVRQNRQSAVF